MITTGQLRQVVKFEKNNPASTDTGGQTEAYVELLTTRGYLKSRSAGRSLVASQLLALSSHELVCRFQTALENALDSSVRVVINNQFYTIADWRQDEEKRYYYVFQLNSAKK